MVAVPQIRNAQQDHAYFAGVVAEFDLGGEKPNGATHSETVNTDFTGGQPLSAVAAVAARSASTPAPNSGPDASGSVLGGQSPLARRYANMGVPVPGARGPTGPSGTA